MVVTVVAGLGVCLIRLHSASTRRQVQLVDRKRAFYVAEAGLSESFLAITQGKSGRVGSEQVPASFGDGVYWVQADATEEGNVALTSTGLCGVGRFSISLVLRPQVDPLAARGVFSGSDLLVEPGVVVDGYDSGKSSFEEQVAADGNEEHTDDGAMLSSNADVYLEGVLGGLPLPPAGGPIPGQTQVFGEVHPGPSGALVIEPGAYVSGSTTPTNHYGVLPAFEVPEVPSISSMVVPSGQTLTLTQREFTMENLLVRGGGRLVLAGPLTLVVESFRTSDRSQVHFDTSGGDVTLIVTEHLDVQHGTHFGSSSEDPTGVSLIVTASEWQDFDGDGTPESPLHFEPNGVFYGFLYVPYVELSLPSSLRLFGAVAAESLTLEAGFRMTVDRSLIDGDAGDGTFPRFLSWRIVELPDSPLVNVRLDPRGLLNLQGITPIPSDKAHAESNVDIDYFDTAGTLQSYSGAASSLDWGDVNTVVSIDWN